MKKRKTINIFSFIICLTAFLFQANAYCDVLDDSYDLSRLRGSKLGYYIGSFDPIHLGHQNVIDKALESGYVDRVLIYPAPGGDQYKNRCDLKIRYELIKALYQHHPKVLITQWTPHELQLNFNESLKDLNIVGIIGSDVITEKLMGPDTEISEKYKKVFMRGITLDEKHYHDTVGVLMALKADSFLVALRDNIDFSYLDNRIYDRPILAFLYPKSHSSTEVRNAIKNGTSFEHLVSFSTQALIKQKGLYGYPCRFNKELHDEIITLRDHDQAARASIKSIQEITPDTWKTIEEVDIRHASRLKEIIEEYGWPGVSVVGLDGSNAMWLLVQHQDKNHPFQKRCAELLQEAVKRYEATPQTFAYLTDRIRLNEDKPQIYGTQWNFVEGELILYPVENRDTLDAVRSQMGLNSMAESEKELRSAYRVDF